MKKKILKEFGFKYAWAVNNKLVDYNDPHKISRIEFNLDRFNQFIL